MERQVLARLSVTFTASRVPRGAVAILYAKSTGILAARALVLSLPKGIHRSYNRGKQLTRSHRVLCAGGGVSLPLMPLNDQRNPLPPSRSSVADPGAATEARPNISARLEQFERRQGELWRLTFFLLLVLAVVFAVVSWDNLRALARHYEALPIGLVVLV